MISAPPRTRSQVVLSFARSDRELADRVEPTLLDAGLEVVRMNQLRGAGEYNDAVRLALKRADALVVALGGHRREAQVPASVTFEIGAAMGAEKPIFVVVEQPQSGCRLRRREWSSCPSSD